MAVAPDALTKESLSRRLNKYDGGGEKKELQSSLLLFFFKHSLTFPRRQTHFVSLLCGFFSFFLDKTRTLKKMFLPAGCVCVRRRWKKNPFFLTSSSVHTHVAVVVVQVHSCGWVGGWVGGWGGESASYHSLRGLICNDVQFRHHHQHPFMIIFN